MLFSSLEFVFLFFPLALLVYFFVPYKVRNYWLLLISLFFYAWGEPKFIIAMLISIIFNFFAALRVEELKNNKPYCRLIMAVTVIFNLGLLFVFKYMNFVTENLIALMPGIFGIVSKTSFVLPIGISFFTFQALSYVIDVYRGIPAQKKLSNVALYISFFPQLIAGPIVRYTTVMEEIEDRNVTAAQFSKGIMRFLRGFNKKILLANIFAVVADKAFSATDLSVGMAWLGAICYSLQIFYDFSGYSDMAIGLGRMFGFHFLENFDFPYISKTVTEFWRRWHISLGSWFRDYLYFPLGGSRVASKFRLIFNLAVVWLATGIWHGANWTFIIWGVLHGVFVITEKLLSIPKRIEKNKATTVVYRIFTLLIVVVGWVFFRANHLSHGVEYLGVMFGVGSNSLFDMDFSFNLRENSVTLAAGLICSTPILKILKEKLSERDGRLQVACDAVSCITQFVLFCVSISFLVMNAHNPFIYFNF